MSKIAIIGATGRAGSQLLEEALRRGHSVLAIARDPSKLEGAELIAHDGYHWTSGCNHRESDGDDD